MMTLNASDKLNHVGGLRAEHTSLKVNGWLYEPVEGQPNYRGRLKQQLKKNGYQVLLPMLHVRYAPVEDLNLRLAATIIFSLPDSSFLVAGVSYKVQYNIFFYGNPILVKSYNIEFIGTIILQIVSSFQMVFARKNTTWQTIMRGRKIGYDLILLLHM